MKYPWGKKANRKTELTRKQSTPNFPKNEHFLFPKTHTYVDDIIRWRLLFLIMSVHTFKSKELIISDF